MRTLLWWTLGRQAFTAPNRQSYEGLRLLRALSFARSEERDNGYARPLDGIVVVIDVSQMEVLRVEDYGVAPLPRGKRQLGARIHFPHTRTDLKPIEIIQPEGPSFSVSGNLVEWQKWKFRVGFTSREGLVLHTISYTDESGERPILHRASICEMVVPYGDPRAKPITARTRLILASTVLACWRIRWRWVATAWA